jgi:hypothetical protein
MVHGTRRGTFIPLGSMDSDDDERVFPRLCKQPARLREANRALPANSRLNTSVVAIIEVILITRGAEENLVHGRLQARPPSNCRFPVSVARDQEIDRSGGLARPDLTFTSSECKIEHEKRPHHRHRP